MTDQATREAAADLIDGAIDIIHERGWCQNGLTDEAGRVCIVEALDRSDQHLTHSRPLWGWITAVEVIEREAASEVVMFNNHPSTTVEDVLLTMKQASASLREVTA